MNEKKEVVPNILIVDDLPANLEVLAGMLKKRGFEVRPVLSGSQALQAAKSDPPDLVLLDINMPEMDGFEVCERLKAEPKLSEIPVIFISAYTETVDKLKAFQAGGVDFVTKPFQIEEVRARVDVHLKIRSLQRDLRSSNERLSASLARLRELESLRDSLVHMMVHDLKAPLTAIGSGLQMLQAKAGDSLPINLVKSVHLAESSVKAMMRMVNSILGINKLEEGKPELNLAVTDLGALAREALGSMEFFRGGNRVIVKSTPAGLTAPLDAEMITRVIQNLLDNAYKFSPPDTSIHIAIRQGDGGVELSVSDSGPGIPGKFHKKIFDKFTQVEPGGGGPIGSTGLGLAYCKLAVEAHGGRIWVENRKEKGSVFKFVLPASAQTEK